MQLSYFNVPLALKSGFFVCGTSGSGKTNLAKWLAKTLITNGVTVFVVDPSQAWTRNTPIGNILTIPSKFKRLTWRGSTVFDISQMNMIERNRFTNGLCRTIFQKHVEGYTHEEFIIFEEAQTYLPNGCLRSPKKYGSVLDIISQGRNYHIRFGLITQFPSNVDKYPVKMTEQRYFGWTWERNDVNYIKAFIGKQMSEGLKRLKQGEFYYQNKAKIRKISTPLFEDTPNIKVEWNWDSRSTSLFS